ncbi:uncharacterized protein METZ01_LOCUS121074 [marine metagenome]|uniref:Uncharacterized protein n=1 Tax=marine metagenome TaxID=408172 RepID=A0A381XU97_9ZZZZ
MANQMTMPGSIPVGPQTTPLSPDGTQPQMAQPNPLQKYFRQPKVYITLPSKGNWYPQGAIEMPDNGEIPVYAMTAKDELTFKTPDALLNGTATVDVIQSCVPAIKDAWNMPTIDLDTVLVGLRIATYGHELDLKSKVPDTAPIMDKSYTLDLRKILDKFGGITYDHVLNHNGMKITLRPQNYTEFTKTALKTFEEQRLFSAVNDTEISEEEKLKRFNDSFIKLTDITINTVTNSIVQIQVGDDVVVDKGHIAEFIEKADKEFYTAIVDHVQLQRAKFEMQPIDVEATEEEVKAGAPAKYKIPVSFDQSNFFA